MQTKKGDFMTENAPVNLERRHGKPSHHVMWAQLNVTQKAAVNSLFNYGYELSFVRSVNGEKLIVMLLNGAPVTIDEDGGINTQPSIKVRT